MKKFLFCLVGFLAFTTAFVSYECLTTTQDEVYVGEYGGPFRHWIQQNHQKRQIHRQRHHKKDDVDFTEQ